ncbi:hypothetical protein HDV03_000333 [Kappamyces sp. JEL0829]|nr:hypothetical protein HDV03_000333 [Kappamyces sp. JEL0829]
MKKLATFSKHGVPDKVTTTQLSAVSPAEGSSEVDVLYGGNHHYVKKLRGEVGRYCKQRGHFFSSRQVSARMEHVISSYLDDNHSKDYHPSMVPLCAPLVFVYSSSETVTLKAFSQLQDMLDEWFSTYSLDQQLSNFLVLFRMLIPELYSHFEEEQVDLRGEGGVSSWFDSLLSKQLSLENVMRLWDLYFASGTQELSMHVYICLAILHQCKEDLEELDQSEIHGFLHRLPSHINLEAVFEVAHQLAFEAKSLGVSSVY